MAVEREWCPGDDPEILAVFITQVKEFLCLLAESYQSEIPVQHRQELARQARRFCGDALFLELWTFADLGRVICQACESTADWDAERQALVRRAYGFVLARCLDPSREITPEETRFLQQSL